MQYKGIEEFKNYAVNTISLNPTVVSINCKFLYNINIQHSIIWYQSYDTRDLNFFFRSRLLSSHLLLLFFFLFTSTMSSSSIDTINVSDNITILNVNMMNVTKLDSLNYLMWSRQVHANLLDGYNLAGHLDGSTVVPCSMINTDDGSVPNPSYTLWKLQDRLIYSALLGAITTTIQPILSTTATTSEI